jgi:hypothetical protein
MNMQVLVIGDNVEDQLAAYDGNRPGSFEARLDKDQVEALYEEHQVKLGDQALLLRTLREDLGWKCRFAGDNLVCRASTNPRTRWHAYTIGGRYFKVDSGTNESSFATQARKREIVDPIVPTHAVVKDGQWYESHYWRFLNGEMVPYPLDEWRGFFNELLAETDDDDVLTQVSCYRSEDGRPRVSPQVERRLFERARDLIKKKYSLYYQSALEGMANPTGEPRMSYYGKVIRIPRRELDTPHSAILRRDLMQDLPSLLRGYGGPMPAPGGPLERIEVRDVDTGDLLIMWRLPFLSVEQPGVDDSGVDKFRSPAGGSTGRGNAREMREQSVESEVQGMMAWEMREQEMREPSIEDEEQERMALEILDAEMAQEMEREEMEQAIDSTDGGDIQA